MAPAADRFDQEAMRAAAWAELGIATTRRLVVDWTVRGLIAAPTVGPRGGGGRGSSATWSSSDRELWLLQLQTRALQQLAGRVDLATLANLPVGMWIYSDMPIMLTQVRRAMTTWRTRRSNYRAGRLAASATTLISWIRHRDATPAARKRLRRLLVGKDLERPAARHRVRAAIDDVVRPRTANAAGGSLRDVVAEHTGRILVARFIGLSVIPDDPLDERFDDLFLAARERARIETDRHARSDLARTIDRLDPSRQEPVGEVERIWVACLDLVTALGLVQLEGLER